MVSAPTINALRYTALFSGIVYGWSHRRTLQAAHDAHKIEHAEHEQDRLIAQAKEAWKAKQLADKNVDSIITDPEDPRFDLEKLIAKWEKAT